MPRGTDSQPLSVAQLERMLAKRRSELNALSRRRAAVMRKLDTIDAKIQRLGGGMGGRGRARNDRSLSEVMHDVMGKTGKAMRVSEIAAAVRSSGYRSNSANPTSIVNQVLIKDKRFGKIGRGVYQLKK